MEPEPWNKAHIPYPSATSLCKVTFNKKTAAAADSVLVLCENALKLLNSEVLQFEVQLLYRIMYVVNNSLRQHKPFGAIRQVKQCINRLEQMKLLAALQDLQELCPNSMQRDVGLEVGFCDVPSQPMLEWVCLKLLGAARLLSRTLDQCTKAFLLTRQHLLLSEFIILNFVLVSLLSRLWVFFRGILKALGPLYRSTKDLLKEVMQYQPMAYLTDFTLPEDLASFLGFPNSKLLTESDTTETLGKKVNKQSVLNKMFDAKVEKKVDEENEIMQMLTCENVTSDADLGKALKRQDQYCFDSPSVLDIKSILLQSRGITKKHTVNIFSKTSTPEQPSASASAAHQQKEFLKLLRTATTFRQMTMNLEEMISWCRRCRLHQQRRCLAFILLWCRKMQNTESKSISTKKKLQRIYVQVQRVLHGKTFPKRPSISSYWRAKGVLTTNFPTMMMRYGSIRHRCGVIRKQSRLAKNLFGATSKPMFKHRGEMRNVTTHKDVFDQKDSGIMKNSTKLVDDSEIDDIFASIDFMV